MMGSAAWADHIVILWPTESPRDPERFAAQLRARLVARGFDESNITTRVVQFNDIVDDARRVTTHVSARTRLVVPCTIAALRAVVASKIPIPVAFSIYFAIEPAALASMTRDREITGANFWVDTLPKALEWLETGTAWAGALCVVGHEIKGAPALPNSVPTTLKSRQVLAAPGPTSPEFRSFDHTRCAAYLVALNRSLINRPREFIAAMTALNRPTVYERSEFHRYGAMFAFQSHADSTHEQLTDMMAQVLRGVSAASIPQIRPTRFELVANHDAMLRAKPLKIRRSMLMSIARYE
jgi:hypothetical protein